PKCLLRFMEALLRVLGTGVPSFEAQPIGLGIDLARRGYGHLLLRREFDLDLACHCASHLALEAQYIAQGPIVALCPEHPAARRLHELDRDPDAILLAADGAG